MRHTVISRLICRTCGYTIGSSTLLASKGATLSQRISRTVLYVEHEFVGGFIRRHRPSFSWQHMRFSPKVLSFRKSLAKPYLKIWSKARIWANQECAHQVISRSSGIPIWLFNGILSLSVLVIALLRMETSIMRRVPSMIWRKTWLELYWILDELFERFARWCTFWIRRRYRISTVKRIQFWQQTDRASGANTASASPRTWCRSCAKATHGSVVRCRRVSQHCFAPRLAAPRGFCGANHTISTTNAIPPTFDKDYYQSRLWSKSTPLTNL